jgi:signal transduction histidine kinase
MRAKPSSTASGMYSRSESLTPPISIAVDSLLCGQVSTPPGLSCSSSGSETPQDEGLLHDARNLMGTIGLYCDLLSMPDVLKPEHRHYAEELRMLGTRSGALIQHLMERHMQSPLAQGQSPLGSCTGAAWQAGAVRSLGLEKVRAAEGGVVERPGPWPAPVSLRAIVERCSGLLSQVAGGRGIEVSYGTAASFPAAVGGEAVERILVNLVRNSAAAMCGPEGSDDPAGDAMGSAVRGKVLERIADGTADETPGAIRIGVGVVINRMDDPRPWPLRRVRLTVEDSGCGMVPEQIERILSGYRAPSRGSHGIGLRVVRELVAASAGDLRVMSAPGIGTRVQIEWPASAGLQEDAAGSSSVSCGASASGRRAETSESPALCRERRGQHAAQGLRTVEVDAVPESGIDSAAGDGRWTIC